MVDKSLEIVDNFPKLCKSSCITYYLLVPGRKIDLENMYRNV